MSKVAIKLSTLTDIGNAVRAKKGTAEQIPVANLANEIQSIQGGTDTSADTVTAESMLEGVTAHNASGEPIVGVIPLYDGAVTGGLSVMANASKYLYGREVIGDNNSLSYNGMVVPNIDTLWTDKETYPYALLTSLTTRNGYKWYQLHLSTTRPYFNGSLITFAEDGRYNQFTYHTDPAVYELVGAPALNEWYLSGENKTYNANRLSIVGEKIWSNNDILNSDGSVYVATTEPTSPYITIDGVAYEGIVLPNIDEAWTDKETYPYADIIAMDASEFGMSGNVAHLCLTNKPKTYDDVDGIANVKSPCKVEMYLFVSTEELANAVGIVANRWELIESIDDTSSDMTYGDTPTWSSYNVLNTDGTLCLKAIEPIPIYE